MIRPAFARVGRPRSGGTLRLFERPARAVTITNIVIEGDSIASNVPSTPANPSPAAGDYWSYAYAATRPDKTIYVRAQGSRIVGQPANLNDDGNSLVGNVAEDAAFGPQLVTAMIGANDLWSSRTAPQYLADLNFYGQQLRAAGLKFAYCFPMPYGQGTQPGTQVHPGYATFTARRNELLGALDIRNPAVWSQFADYFVPSGMHPDFADPVLGSILIPDGVHPAALNASPSGAALLLAVNKAAFDTILDPARASATAPAAAVWPANRTGLVTGSVQKGRIILSGLAPAQRHPMSISGANAKLKTSFAATGAGPILAYNGDVIDWEVDASASAGTTTSFDLTIGTETRSITLRTAAAVAPVAYTHHDIYTDAGPQYATAAMTVTAVPFVAGRALIAVFGKGQAAIPSVTVKGAAATFIGQQQGEGADHVISLWHAPVSAGAGDVAVTFTGGYARAVVSIGTLANADPSTLAMVSNAPPYSGPPHSAPAITIPAGGLGIAAFGELAGVTYTPATVQAPGTLIDEGSVEFQSDRRGLAIASFGPGQTVTPTFGFPFGYYPRVALVVGPMGG